ncbi:MAG TPA: class I SAM-dependent methyltransferase [Polyangiaceae bacterium]|nr:class I SAM-dependent methyltransferase [Polyangiaceae bacterium]
MALSVGNPRIAPTAHFTAQAWVRAGFENAALFDTLEGRLLYGSASRFLGLLSFGSPLLQHYLDYLHVRHAAFESRLRALAPDAIVEIGAGLSPRGLSFCRRNPNLVYLEADLPAMVREKERALASVMRPSNYHLTTVDLLDGPLEEQLPRVVERGMRVVVVTEGVVDYLDMGEKRRAFSAIASFLRSHGGGTYLFEAHARELFVEDVRFARVFTALLGTLVGRNFEGRIFETVDDARRAVVESGFDTAAVLDIEALNDTSKRPPLRHCRYRLLEAVIREAT